MFWGEAEGQRPVSEAGWHPGCRRPPWAPGFNRHRFAEKLLSELVSSFFGGSVVLGRREPGLPLPARPSRCPPQPATLAPASRQAGPLRPQMGAR